MPDVSLRTATRDDLAEATALCLRSKAHWGYDAEFIAACRDELTLRPAELVTSCVIVATLEERIVGVSQLSTHSDTAELDKLFVEPELIGQGIGRKLFNAAIREAKAKAVVEKTLTADPFAAPIYEKMGFLKVCEEPSGSIPGRMLGVYKISI